MSGHASVAAPALRAPTIILWILRGLAAFGFVSSAALKFAGVEMTVAEFDQLGLGQWLRYFIAFVELIGGIMVLTPRVSRLGATLLLLLDVCAFFAQVTVLHIDWIHTLVIASILVAIMQLQLHVKRVDHGIRSVA